MRLNMKKTYNGRKWIVKGIICCLFAVILCGCSYASEKHERRETEDVITLELWTGEAHAKMTMNRLFEEFNNTIGKQEGIQLVNVVMEELDQTLAVAFETGQEPAFFYTGNIVELAEKNLIMPINQLTGSDKIIKRAETAGILQEYIHIYKDNIYCIPFMASAKGILYNKELFVKAGIVDENGEAKPPTTMEEVRIYANLLTDESKQQYGLVLPLRWNAVFEGDLSMATEPSTGYVMGYNPETGEFDYSTMKPVLETFLAMKEDGSIMPGAEGMDNDTARARFANGDIGMKFGWYYDVGVLTTQFKAKCEWGVAPLPIVDKEDCYKQTFGINSGYRISKSAIDKYGEEKIMIAYNWLYSEEILSELYKNGCYLPCYTEIIENTQIEDEKLVNWKAFADILEDSVLTPQIVRTETSGVTDLQSNFINQVWYGKMSLDDALLQETLNKNEGAKKYRELNPEYDVQSILVENWFELMRKE